MRVAIAISVLAASFAFSLLRADESFPRVALGSGTGYVIPEAYAAAHKADIISSIPVPIRIEAFWTPTEADVVVAERVFRELIQGAAKDPKLIFPNLEPGQDPDSPDSLERQQAELTLVSKNYGVYARQYVGIIVAGNKLILCNYSDAPKVDASTEYLYVEKYVVPNGSVHFLQCRVDPHWKTWSNVSLIGSWQPRQK